MVEVSDFDPKFHPLFDGRILMMVEVSDFDPKVHPVHDGRSL